MRSEKWEASPFTAGSSHTDIKNFADAIGEIAKAIYDLVKWIYGLNTEKDKAMRSGFVQGNIWQGVKEAYVSGNDLVNKGIDSLFPSGNKPTKTKTYHDVFNNIIKTESGWDNTRINSTTGARGLGQIIKSTADLYGFDWERLKTDPVYNYWSSKKIFEDNFNQHNGDYAKALAQYNGGSKAVKGNNLNINAETINYLHKILSAVPEAANQHPNLLRELSQLQIEANRKGNENRRFTIHLEEKAGSDFNLALQSQGQIPG